MPLPNLGPLINRITGGADTADSVGGRSNPIPPSRDSIDISNPDGILSGEDNEGLLHQILHKHTLDDYVSTKYNIELSLVGDANKGITDSETLKELGNRFFIAKSDTTRGNPEEYGDRVSPVQFFIKTMNFKTINSLSTVNPETPNTAIFSMDIEEPYGFSLDRTIREAGITLGYSQYFPPNRFIFRLDIWFSGYKESSGEFVERIPVINPYPILSTTHGTSGDAPSIAPELPGNPDSTHETTILNEGHYTTETSFSYFVHIIQIEAELSNGNSTSYKLQMLPVQDIAMYPEYDTLNPTDLELSESDGNSTFGDYITELQNYLNEFYKWSPPIGYQISRQHDAEEIQAQVEQSTVWQGDQVQLRKYIFHVPSELRDEPFDFLPETSNDEERVASSRLSARSRSIREDMFHKITYTTEGRNALMTNNYPREVYTVRARLDYSKASEEHMGFWGDLVKVKVHYYIEKKKEYRYTPAGTSSVANWSSTARERASEIIGSGALKKVYKYVFSGDNTVVKSFQLNANVFWNHLTPRPEDDPRYNSTEVSLNESEQNNNTTYNLYSENSINKTITEIYGNTQEAASGNLFPSRRNMNRNMIQNARTTPTPDETVPNDVLFGYALYQERLENSLRVSSIKLEGLDIRGDPQWLASIYSLNENQMIENATNEVASSLATDIIYLKLLYPDQSEYMNEDSDTTKPILLSANYGGFFQIISVEHSFEGGIYNQKLTGYRLSQEIASPTGNRVSTNE